MCNICLHTVFTYVRNWEIAYNLSMYVYVHTLSAYIMSAILYVYMPTI